MGSQKNNYQNKDWLEDQYIDQEKSQRDIAEECNTSRGPIRYWMKKFNIAQRTIAEATKISQNKPEIIRKISDGNKGENSYRWEGDNVSYNGLHTWLRRHKPKPEVCEICGKEGKLELSCKDHKYGRDFNNYQYIHRDCHVKYDKENGLKRRLVKKKKK